jgi:hypothetical protein
LSYPCSQIGSAETLLIKDLEILAFERSLAAAR